MSGLGWERRCMLCGRVGASEFAYLPNPSGCAECNWRLGMLRPKGVVASRARMTLFQTFSVNPRSFDTLHERLDGLARSALALPMPLDFPKAFSEAIAAIKAVISDLATDIQLGTPKLSLLSDAWGASQASNWRVLDCSTLALSGTAKDIRTFGIISSLAGSPIRHLVAWTAGNAGMSLISAIRPLREPAWESPVTVNLLVQGDTPKEIIQQLTGAGAQVTSCGSRKPLSTAQSVRLAGGDPRSNTWLDVTDGWDEAGMFAYRCVAYWLMTLLKPDAVVVPVGTGGLFVGFALGISDYLARHRANECTLVGALPAGPQNTVDSFGFKDQPMAPKLAGRYSPLGMILAALYQGEAVVGVSASLRIQFRWISRAEQSRAALKLRGSLLKIEPSGIVALAAIGENFKNGLVISTGFGLIGEPERQYLLDTGHTG
jgi:hypothetical protein